jgi:uncharacterized protein (TIGR02996 family)
MTHTDALLEAIRDEPDNPDLRLVYADWLDETGDAARARFIRTSCAHERLARTDPRRHALGREAGGLLHRHRRAWLGPLWARLGDRRWRWGLLDEASLTVQHFLAHADALLRLGPLTALRLVGASADVAELCRSPQLLRLRSLDLSCNFLTNEAAAALAGSPWTGRWRALSLRQNFIGAPGAEALADSLHLDDLRRLDLGSNRLPQAARAALRDRFGDGVTF